jgi:protein TonB
MQLNPAAEAVASIPESKPQVSEAVPATTPVQNERAVDRPVAQPANPRADQAAPVKPELAPAAERTGPVQQAMRTEPNEAMVRGRPDRGDPTIANDKKPAREKEEKKKPKARAMASTAASASSPSRPSPDAGVAGSAASATYRALVMAELNRRKFYPPDARDQRGVVVVTFAIGSSGSVTSSRISRSSGVSALDGAVLQMMRSVSLPPPPGGSFHATAPIRFDVQR